MNESLSVVILAHTKPSVGISLQLHVLTLTCGGMMGGGAVTSMTLDTSVTSHARSSHTALFPG